MISFVGYIPHWPSSFPLITGWDVSGVIEEVGSEVTKFNVGDEVYSYNRPAFDEPERAATEGTIGVNGCCAEFVSVAEWKVALKPKIFPLQKQVNLILLGRKYITYHFSRRWHSIGCSYGL